MMMEGLGYGINKGSSRIFFSLLCPPCSLLYKQTHTELSGALGLVGWGGGALQPGLITTLRRPKSPKQEVLTTFEEETNRRSSNRTETVKVDILRAPTGACL